MGPSAIVKVSGQNSFRTLYGFLRPILVVSLVLWGSSVLGCQKVPRKVPSRFRQGSAKVSPRFHQGSTKVPPRFSKCCGVSSSLGQIHQGSPGFVVSLALWGRSVLGCQKVPRKVSPRFRQRSPSFVVSL